MKKCKKCGKCCCGDTGPIIFPRDIEPICAKIDLNAEEFLNRFCIERHHNKKKEILIYFLKAINDKCIFLNENNLCLIYDVRPYQCRNAPFNFFPEYHIWKHMVCINKEDFDNHNGSFSKDIFEEILTIGYRNRR